MSLNDTPRSERVQIGFFGKRNAGKSSVLNAVCGQPLAVVSDVLGTTTDPVLKSMEILPLGPVVLIDTPGIDDSGELGKLRVQKAESTLDRVDIAVLVTSAPGPLDEYEKELIHKFEAKKIRHITAYNKSDLLENVPEPKEGEIYISAKTGAGIFELKEMIAALMPQGSKKQLAGDLVPEGSVCILVTPIDAGAPKGRMILPQQMVLRDLLDHDRMVLVVKPMQLKSALSALISPPGLVITDSQAFKEVASILPADTALTSFSILMARYKGFLETAVKGAAALKELKDGDRVLICEGCTHHRQCDDIGTIKLPRWIGQYTKKEIKFEFTSGIGYKDKLEGYSLIVHCGGCMLSDKQILSRMQAAVTAGVPFTNYGTVIALINGVLGRSIAMIDELKEQRRKL